MNLIEPFATQLHAENGRIDGAQNLIQRRLSDMVGMYHDAAAVEAILAENDRLLYEVYAPDLPEEEGQVLYCTTIIYPGKIGDEYHMTKGHFHAKRNQGEVYFGLSGEGVVLLQTDSGDVRDVPMVQGAVVYVPPYWAHRTVNTGTESLTFFSVWPADAGHDYGTIEAMGFPKLLVEQAGKPTLIDNPNFKRG